MIIIGQNGCCSKRKKKKMDGWKKQNESFKTFFDAEDIKGIWNLIKKFSLILKCKYSGKSKGEEGERKIRLLDKLKFEPGAQQQEAMEGFPESWFVVHF